MYFSDSNSIPEPTKEFYWPRSGSQQVWTLPRLEDLCDHDPPYPPRLAEYSLAVNYSMGASCIGIKWYSLPLFKS